MFKCKACPPKDEHIKSLNEQIQYLRALVYNPNDASKIPYINIEMNKALEGSNDTIDVPLDPSKDYLEEQRRIYQENIDIMTGNY